LPRLQEVLKKKRRNLLFNILHLLVRKILTTNLRTLLDLSLLALTKKCIRRRELSTLRTLKLNTILIAFVSSRLVKSQNLSNQLLTMVSK
jgi:hypothetical protein